jgi:hypothetical protein
MWTERGEIEKGGGTFSSLKIQPFVYITKLFLK